MTAPRDGSFVEVAFLGSAALALIRAAVNAEPVRAIPATQQTSDFHAKVVAALLRPDSPDWVTRPVWTRRPTGDDILLTYPSGLNRGAAGRVTIVCEIDDHGALEPCEIREEEPAGGGFGAAGLKLSRKFRMKVVDATGLPVAGRLISIPITYRSTGR